MNAEHRLLRTVERPEAPEPPKSVRKRNGAVEDFDLRKIRTSIGRALSNGVQVPQSVVEGVLARVKAAVHRSEEIVDSRKIASVILQELTNNRQIHVVSRIRYAMATPGSVKDTALDSLSAIHAWLEAAWPDREDPPLPLGVRRPVLVRQRGSSDVERWDTAKLARSILTAAKGRDASWLAEPRAAEVAEQVRQHLQDQTLVTSEQVASEVMRVLRTADPLTYLWYASVYKHFRSAAEFWHEITDLQGAGRQQDAPPHA